MQQQAQRSLQGGLTTEPAERAGGELAAQLTPDNTAGGQNMDDKHEAQELTPAQKMEQEMREELEQQFRTATRRGAELLDASTKAKMAADSLKETGAAMTDTVQSVIQEVAAFAQSDSFRAIKGTLLAVASFAQTRTEYTEAAERILDAVAKTTDLYPIEGTMADIAPFFAVELERLHKMQPEFTGLTLQELTEKAVALFPAPADPEQLQLDLQLFGSEPDIDPNQAQLIVEALTTAETSFVAFTTLTGAAESVAELERKARKAKGEADRRATRAAQELAKEQGALMTLGGRVATYSSAGFENLLNTPNIYEFAPDEEIKNPFTEKGQLKPALVNKPGALKKLDSLHIAFLWAVNQAVLAAAENNAADESGLISANLTAMCNELGIDPRKFSTLRDSNKSRAEQRLDAFISLLRPFENKVGKTLDNSYWRIMAFHSYNATNDTVKFFAPFLLQEYLQYMKTVDGAGINRLLHGSVVNEQNQAAVELANSILNGLKQRGLRPDYKTYKKPPRIAAKTKTVKNADGSTVTTKEVYAEEQTEAAPTEEPKPKVTYSVKFSTLIKRCPQFKYELDSLTAETRTAKKQKENQTNDPTAEGSTSDADKMSARKSPLAAAYNTRLKRTFEAAFRIIMEKSDAPDYYLNFDFSPKHPRTGKILAPTKSTLGRELTITHDGKNPHFAGQDGATG